MYFTYVIRPGDAPESRKPQFEPIWEFLMNYNLRLGFLIQLASYTILISSIYAGGKSPFGLLSFLRATVESIGVTPFSSVLFCHGGFIIGTLLIMAFIQMAEDDSSIKQSRGYRAGTKFILQATSFASVSWCLSMVTFLGATYYFDSEWLDEQIGVGSNWIIHFTSRVLDSFALLCYAGGCFFLEAYHSHGTSEIWGWICGASYLAAGATELFALITYNTPKFSAFEYLHTLSFGLSLLVSCVWAFLFEPVSHLHDVKLNQSALRNEYYKSKNALAYYGPAVVTENGEIDISS